MVNINTFAMVLDVSEPVLESSIDASTEELLLKKVLKTNSLLEDIQKDQQAMIMIKKNMTGKEVDSLMYLND